MLQDGAQSIVEGRQRELVQRDGRSLSKSVTKMLRKNVFPIAVALITKPAGIKPQKVPSPLHVP